MYRSVRRKQFEILLVISLFSIIISSLMLNLSQPKGNIPTYYSSITIPTNSIKRELTTPTEFEDFLDSVIFDQMGNYSLAGVTFSMVKDGSIFFEKGYGYANTVLETPVIANETLFRIGSISKTFTAVAVLQLIEEGLLELDTDINSYLTAFKIPETYEEPITLRHLLTHTAGFEEKTFPSIVGSMFYNDMESILISGMPDRVHHPGMITSYSNYGFLLAGYIVQEISGKEFEIYVQEEILDPLGMNSTTFDQPIPSWLNSRMATGYDENGNTGYFEYITVPPAGAGSATASDIGRFMITLLNKGSLGEIRILENATVEQMLSDQFITHENLPSMGLGVYEFHQSEEQIIGHGGDTRFFHSRMILLPEQNIGIFASYNSVEGSIARTLLFDEIVEEYFPYQKQDIQPMDGYKSRARKFAGFYVTTRRIYSDKPNADERDFLSESFTLTSKDGLLYIEGISNTYFVEVEPNYFVESTGEYYLEIGFVRDEKGKITHFYTNFVGPYVAYERTHPLYYGSEYQSIMISVIIIIMILSVIYWVIETIVLYFKKKEKPQRNQLLARLNFIIATIFLGVTAIFVDIKLKSDILLEREVVNAFGGLLALPFLFLLAVIGAIVMTGTLWFREKKIEKETKLKKFEKVHYSIILLLLIITIGIFASWHLFTF